jgi:hypothetical protein
MQRNDFHSFFGLVIPGLTWFLHLRKQHPEKKLTGCRITSGMTKDPVELAVIILIYSLNVPMW